MAVGTFNPHPPFPILDGGSAGDWWVLRYTSWVDVHEPGHAVGRYATVDGHSRTVEVFGQGFAYADSRLYGPSAGPLVSGTVTEYRVSSGGVPLWTFTGLSLTAEEILRYGSNPDPTVPASTYDGLENHVLRGADTITGTEAADSTSGRGGDDYLDGRGGNDTLVGGAGDNRLEGGDGDDLVMAGIGRDLAHGGAGTDTFLVAFTLRQQAQVVLSASEVTLAGPYPQGQDTLIAFERIAFADGILHLDSAGAAGEVWRLYDAAFGRDAETTGLSAWVGALDAGTASMDGLARSFLGSAEFAQRYGQLDDAGFVSRLYANVLHRAPDAGGLEHWTARLADGARRSELLLAFSEAAEHRAATDARIADGLWTVDPEAMEALRLYATILDRLPDADGLVGWTLQRNNNLLTAGEMADAFIGSAEFQSRFGALSNEDFVARLYTTALDRPADTAGLADWTAKLDSGAIARRDVVQAFAYSEEMTQKLLPLVDDGIAFA